MHDDNATATGADVDQQPIIPGWQSSGAEGATPEQPPLDAADDLIRRAIGLVAGAVDEACATRRQAFAVEQLARCQRLLAKALRHLPSSGNVSHPAYEARSGL